MTVSTFNLGDGVSSITGAHKGKGIILNKILPSQTPGDRAELAENHAENKHETRPAAHEAAAPHAQARVTTSVLSHHSAAATSASSSAITTSTAIGVDTPPSSPITDEEKVLQKALLKPYRAHVKTIQAQRTEGGGAAKYQIHNVRDYKRLKEVLGISASVSGTVSPSTSVSADMKFAQTVILTREDITLVIIGERVSHIDSLPRSHDLAIDLPTLDSIIQNPVVFKNAYGDHYVASVSYGERFIGKMTIHRISEEKEEDFKNNIQAKLNTIGNANAGGNYTRNELLERAEITIEVQAVGVPGLGIPFKTSSLEEFYRYVESFDNALTGKAGSHVPSPIGYTTEPYVALHHTEELSNLEENIKLAGELLTKYDLQLSRARLVISSAKRIVTLVERFTPAERLQVKNQLQRFINIRDESMAYELQLQSIMLKIEAAQTDLIGIAENIVVDYRLNKDGIRKRLEAVAKLPEPEAKAHQYNIEDFAKALSESRLDIRDQLDALLANYENQISLLEADLDNGTASMVTNVVERGFDLAYMSASAHFPNTQHFHLKIPSSTATLQWELKDLADTLLPEDLVFSVEVSKVLPFTGGLLHGPYHKEPLLNNLKPNAIVELAGIQSTHRYRIVLPQDQFGHKRVQPFKVIVRVVGELALQVHNGVSALGDVQAGPPEKRKNVDQFNKELMQSLERTKKRLHEAVMRMLSQDEHFASLSTAAASASSASSPAKQNDALSSAVLGAGASSPALYASSESAGPLAPAMPLPSQQPPVVPTYV